MKVGLHSSAKKFDASFSATHTIRSLESPPGTLQKSGVILAKGSEIGVWTQLGARRLQNNFCRPARGGRGLIAARTGEPSRLELLEDVQTPAIHRGPRIAAAHRSQPCKLKVVSSPAEERQIKKADPKNDKVQEVEDAPDLRSSEEGEAFLRLLPTNNNPSPDHLKKLLVCQALGELLPKNEPRILGSISNTGSCTVCISFSDAVHFRALAQAASARAYHFSS